MNIEQLQTESKKICYWLFHEDRSGDKTEQEHQKTPDPHRIEGGLSTLKELDSILNP